MELIVVELLGLLKSYGIDVRMTLLEQTLPDPAGGLVYHMQKNIQGCDFVLVLLTEPTGEIWFNNLIIRLVYARVRVCARVCVFTLC